LRDVTLRDGRFSLLSFGSTPLEPPSIIELKVAGGLMRFFASNRAIVENLDFLNNAVSVRRLGAELEVQGGLLACAWVPQSQLAMRKLRFVANAVQIQGALPMFSTAVRF